MQDKIHAKCSDAIKELFEMYTTMSKHKNDHQCKARPSEKHETPDLVFFYSDPLV